MRGIAIGTCHTATLALTAGLGIVPALCACAPPPQGGGLYENPPRAHVRALRVEPHFKNEGIYRSIEIGGTKPLNFFARCKKISEMPKKKSGLRPKNKGGPKIEKKGRFLA